ncbi:uncharacterized protein LOC131233838 isoform X6 [Magnolia sinica]|uniref:uncharacterized protein LOC131233838 isoform X6 n=1 Tax=Magnolia sinica TaxID=86752 RepID=UPI00265A23C3|nr:uncharacterized protein LOC131233838 isoform X6 [Magnolia sinica]
MKDSSPDINKENASMVGSSLTESKQDRENCDDPGNSSYKENEESYPIRAEEQDRPFDGIGSLSTSRNEKPDTTRYFVIKSLSHHNIQLSIEKGIWATQVMNEPILEEAFHELSEDVGEALCRLIDGNIDVDGKLKRNSDFRDEFLLKRPCREIAVPLQDEDYASVSSSNMAWARAPILYPSLLYQQSMLADSHNAQKMHGMSSGVSLPDHLPTHLEVPNVSQMKHSRVRGNSINRRDKRDPVLQLNKKDLSDERSPLADSMSEEDILDMEEHQGSIRKSLPAFHQFVMPSHVPCTLFHNYRHMKNTSGPVAEAMWHLPIWQQQDHHGRCRDHRWLQRMMTMGTPNI